MKFDAIKVFNKRIYAFGMLFLFAITCQLFIDNNNVYWDDAYYWSLGKAFDWRQPNLTYDAFRGYFFPAILSLCYKIGVCLGKEFLGYMILSSMTFAFLFTFCMNKMMKLLDIQISETEKNVTSLLTGIAFFVLFRGLFIYVLSDIYAFVISITTIIISAYFMKESEKKFVNFGALAFLWGITIYLAYNIRTIYMFLGEVIVVVVLTSAVCKKRWKDILIISSGGILGFLVASLPQIRMNVAFTGTYSIAVPTEKLMLKQLGWGVTNGRYSTYIGDGSDYLSAAMYYEDRIGLKIMELEGITKFDSYAHFIRTIFKHPLDFAGIYVRHLLNILYPIYPNQYIKTIENDKSLLLLFFFTIIYLAFWGFLYNGKRKERFLWLGLLCLPCLFILPGAVEIRFFISLYMIVCLYGVIGVKEFIKRFSNHRIRYVCFYIIGFLIYLAYGGLMLSTTVHGTALFNYF